MLGIAVSLLVVLVAAGSLGDHQLAHGISRIVGDDLLITTKEDVTCVDKLTAIAGEKHGMSTMTKLTRLVGVTNSMYSSCPSNRGEHHDCRSRIRIHRLSTCLYRRQSLIPAVTLLRLPSISVGYDLLSIHSVWHL